MTMQRRHFELIAETIKEMVDDYANEPDHPYRDMGRVVAVRFASKLKSTNPQFNRDRFLRACGVED
jgi:hypothetical protein